jgi:RHS repeat-associated protein
MNDTTNWCIARPTRVEDTRSHTLTDGGALTRVTEQTWDGPACRVTNIKAEPGSLWELNTALEYDLFNNVNQSTVTASTIPASIVNKADFGANGHLQQWAEDAKAQRTTIVLWNVNLGLPLTRTDINGLPTTWTYDDLGRELIMTRPDGTSTSKAYYRCDSANAYCGDSLLRYGVRTVERDTAQAEINHADQFFDAMGRVKYEQSLGLNGETIGVQTLYDTLGNVATKSNPFVVGGGTVSGTTYTYDKLKRVVQTRRPASDSDRTTLNEYIDYTGRKTTKTDAAGKAQVTVAAAWGVVSRATDEAGTDTGYTYNAFGELRTVTAPGSIITSLTYNVRGFKDTQNDPDLGSWTYTYDALGQPLSQTDAKGQKTTFTYDVLGRTKTRVDDALGTPQTTTWAWDTGAHGKGLLDNVTAPGGYAEVYAYDALSRRSTLTTTASGGTYAMSYAYDSVTGRLQTMSYPPSTGTAFAARYAYLRGFLKDVRDTANLGTPLWQANAQDPLGHVTQEQFGNGQITNLGFDQTNGRLYRVQTGSGGGAATQNLSYQWDAIGNLQSRNDLAQSVTEAFTYDLTNRVNVVTRNGVTTLSTGFNAIGNITSKSDVGSYDYTTAQAGCSYYTHSQPHAVRKVGTNVYCYDANGNMVSRSGSTVAWSTFNYPTQINQAGGNTSTFYYGADRNAYRQVSVDTGTTEDRVAVADGAFEKLVRSGTQTEYRHSVSANGRVVAIVKRSVQTGDKTFYLHADHLGGTDVITDGGTSMVRTSFDAWGQRRGGGWIGQPSPGDKAAINGSTHRGYTGHEQLDNLNLVHMKGRVYDPAIARFMSADPIIQSPFQSQSFNRYSYVRNNPLNATDPTGFQTIDCFAGSRIHACASAGAAPPSVDRPPADIIVTGRRPTDAFVISAQGDFQRLTVLNDQFESMQQRVEGYHRGHVGFFEEVAAAIQGHYVRDRMVDLGNGFVLLAGTEEAYVGFDPVATEAAEQGYLYLELAVTVATEAAGGAMQVGQAASILASTRRLTAAGVEGRLTATTVIGRFNKDAGEIVGLRAGEKSLVRHFADLGSFKANWAQNAGIVRREMSKGLPIRDAAVNLKTGELIPYPNSFLNAERSLLLERGWSYDRATTLWMPP